VSAEPAGLAVIEELAAGAMAAGRVVVLMERHALPESRWAGVRLLPALRRAGATHLAFEASDQEPLDRAQRDGVVRGDRSLRVRSLARRAPQDGDARGLKLVAFDQPAEPAEIDRLLDRRMAERIHRLVSDGPHARVVVWTGGQHAWKRMPEYFSVPARHPTMAAVLAEVGEEPFCVGQAVVRGSAHHDPGVLRADHTWAAEHGLDAVLVHFRGDRPARPSWIDEGRRCVTLPADGARLVQATPESEGPDAVPVEQLIARTDQVDLMLDPGRYLCRGVDDADRTVWRRSLSA
jgi:hypothetical protein